MTDGRIRGVLWLAAVLGSVVAVWDLYIRYAYRWPSPFDGVLRAGNCAIAPLCDRGILNGHHVGFVSLLLAVGAFAALFRDDRRYDLALTRPVVGQQGALPAWPTGGAWSRPWTIGLALVWTVAALVVVELTIVGSAAPEELWVLTILLGAVAAWRCDRESPVHVPALRSTMAHLAVFLGISGAMLGAGSLWTGQLLGVLPLAFGLALFALGMAFNDAAESSFERIDHLAMFGLTSLSLTLAMIRHRSWRYAFIGDEWTFYAGARDIVNDRVDRNSFDIVDPNGYYVHLTYEFQAAVMRFAGESVFGWRLASVLPVVLSVPLMYAFTKWLAGRTAAVVAAGSLAAGHMLLSFAMVPYNSTQALLAAALCFAALAFAHQRPSALRFYLLGAACGSTFLVFATARLALVPVGLLFLALFGKEQGALLKRLAWAAFGAVSVSAPTLFSVENWRGLLSATSAQAEGNDGSGIERLVTKVLRGFLSFIWSDVNTHHVGGPHLDLIGACLLIVGVGWVASRLRRDAALAGLFAGGALFLAAISGISQYDGLSTTRSFMLPLLYCVFVGVAGGVVAKRGRANLGMAPHARMVGVAAGVGFAVLLAVVNQLHISRHVNGVQQLTAQTSMVRHFQETDHRGGGPQIHVAWIGDRFDRLNMVLSAYEVPRERMAITSSDVLLSHRELCDQQTNGSVAIHHQHERRDELIDHFEQCWNTQAREITNPVGGQSIVVVETPLDPLSLVRWPSTTDEPVRDVIDLAVDGGGSRFALTKSDGVARIVNVETGDSFLVAESSASDFDITSDGLFVIANQGADPRLVWYDRNGAVVRRFVGHNDIPVAGGVLVDGDMLWLSDSSNGRVIGFDPAFEPVRMLYGGDELAEPSALANGPDGSVWVTNGPVGEVLRISPDDVVLARVDAGVAGVFDSPRIGSTSDGSLINVLRDRPEVQLIDPSGAVRQVFAGLLQPRAAALAADGTLLVADPRWTGIANIGAAWGAPQARSSVLWGEVSSEVAVATTIDDPVIGPSRARAGLEFDDVRGDASGETALDGAGLDGVGLGDTADDDAAANDPLAQFTSIADGQRWRSIDLQSNGQIRGIAFAAMGEPVVIGSLGRFVRLDASGAPADVMVLGDGSSGELTAVAIDDEGAAWVIDAANATLYKVEGALPRVVSTDPIYLNARDLVVGSDGTLWIAATATERLVNVARDGAVLGDIFLPGSQPSALVERSDGSFWVVGGAEAPLSLVARDGTILATQELAPFITVEAPKLVIDGSTLWVTDPESGRIAAHDEATGEPIGEPRQLLRPDGGATNKPIGLAVEPGTGRVWIVDSRFPAITVLSP